ncbi:hypothetical protein [Nonomuraea sp. NPDC005501]|uniref:hypothetical protein n=1 Tax=Nonomuraea sp. NPDC005501 TaxID=3156884 RepID=UPI0033BED138
MSQMFFNLPAVFAEFGADLLKMRTREGMAIARSRGRRKGKQPKLTARQQAELVRMHATGDYTIADRRRPSAAFDEARELSRAGGAHGPRLKVTCSTAPSTRPCASC